MAPTTPPTGVSNNLTSNNGASIQLDPPLSLLLALPTASAKRVQNSTAVYAFLYCFVMREFVC